MQVNIAKVTHHKPPLTDPPRESVRSALARFSRKELDSALIMRSVGLKFVLRDHSFLLGTFVFVRRCMGHSTSHARFASEEPLRLCAGDQSAHSARELMCSASFMMVALACTLTTRPGGNWRIFRLQLHGFLSLRLWTVIDVLRSRPGKLVNRSGVILHFVCRNGPHVLRLGWRLGCARRHRPNQAKAITSRAAEP